MKDLRRLINEIADHNEWMQWIDEEEEAERKRIAFYTQGEDWATFEKMAEEE